MPLTVYTSSLSVLLGQSSSLQGRSLFPSQSIREKCTIYGLLFRNAGLDDVSAYSKFLDLRYNVAW